MAMPWWYGPLRVLAPVFTVALCVLTGWLFYQYVTGRLGQAGRLVLLALGLFVALSIPYQVTLANAYAPERAWSTLAVLGGATAVLLIVREVLRLLPFPFPALFSFVLTSPLRRLVMPAEPVLAQLGFGPGIVVVEVGPGPGFFTFEIAPRVLPGGRVVCVDAQAGMVARIEEKARRLGLDCIETRVGRAEELPLDPQSAHIVLMALMLGETRDKQAAVNEAYRVLVPGGVLALAESMIDPHYCTKTEVRKLAVRAGFEEWNVTGGMLSYTANFRKPGQFAWRDF